MGDQMIGKIERESSRRGKLMYSWSQAPSGCWAGGKEKGGWIDMWSTEYRQQWEKQGWVLEQLRRSRIPEKSESEKVGGEQGSFTCTWRRQRRRR